MRSQCTSITPTYNTSKDGFATIIADKRSTGISLASILSTNSWVSAADHGISDGTTIIIITSSVGNGWYSDIFETLRS
jgi:hypothetical protein